jgi:hypothetical protein
VDSSQCSRSLPTKTSRRRLFNRSSGMSRYFWRDGPHVYLTRFVKAVSPFILVAMIRSQVNLSFIAFSHLAFVSPSEWFVSWMTLSQRRTQKRWAASDIRICRSLAAPFCEREGPGASTWGSSLPGSHNVEVADVRRLPKTENAYRWPQ